MRNNIVSVLLNAEEVGQLYWDEIITDGRSKMHIDKIKTLISLYLCPFALRNR
jgi:hypothetical protein